QARGRPRARGARGGGGSPRVSQRTRTSVNRGHLTSVTSGQLTSALTSADMYLAPREYPDPKAVEEGQAIRAALDAWDRGESWPERTPEHPPPAAPIVGGGSDAVPPTAVTTTVPQPAATELARGASRPIEWFDGIFEQPGLTAEDVAVASYLWRCAGKK